MLTSTNSVNYENDPLFREREVEWLRARWYGWEARGGAPRRAEHRADVGTQRVCQLGDRLELPGKARGLERDLAQLLVLLDQLAGICLDCGLPSTNLTFRPRRVIQDGRMWDDVPICKNVGQPSLSESIRVISTVAHAYGIAVESGCNLKVRLDSAKLKRFREMPALKGNQIFERRKRFETSRTQMDCF